MSVFCNCFIDFIFCVTKVGETLQYFKLQLLLKSIEGHKIKLLYERFRNSMSVKAVCLSLCLTFALNIKSFLEM